ncbi:MAG TPA: zinc ribbon domain-containing protein [Nitrospirota bacterium]|jgi:putative FmdB family regulatory protein
MPMYEYKCGKCSETFTMMMRMGAGADGVKCPSCGSAKISKLISSTFTPDSEKGMPSEMEQQAAFQKVQQATANSPCASGACGGGTCNIKEFG